MLGISGIVYLAVANHILGEKTGSKFLCIPVMTNLDKGSKFVDFALASKTWLTKVRYQTLKDGK